VHTNPAGREHLPNRSRDLVEKAVTILQAPPVVVGPMIGLGLQELVYDVSVS
jgi:hypothetical protein